MKFIDDRSTGGILVFFKREINFIMGNLVFFSGFRQCIPSGASTFHRKHDAKYLLPGAPLTFRQ